jgi:hypothetical protein
MPYRRKIILSLLAILAIVGAGTLRADNGEAAALAQRVKAAFIYNFVQFTDWPEAELGAAESPIVIGIVDPDGLGGNMERTIAGKTSHGRPLEVRHITDTSQVAGCHVIVACGDDATVKKMLLAAAGSTLTVGESEAFAQNGGAIRFYMADNKIRFEVNLTATDKAHLQLSSKLLKVATTVRR